MFYPKTILTDAVSGLRASAVETDVTVAPRQRAREIPKFYVALIEMGPRKGRAKILRSVNGSGAE